MERNRGGRPRHPDVLTPAEWRVLEALREGGTNAEIGARLGISADAVKYHVSNMLGKLELRDRHALAAWRPEERRGRLPAWFAVPAALAYVGRPLVWVGLGTAAAVGVTVTVVAAVVAVAVVLVVVGGDGDSPAVALPPAATPDPTSTPAPTVTTPEATPTPAVVPTPAPTVTSAAACTQTTLGVDPATNPGLVSDCAALLGLRDRLAGDAGVLDWSADRPVATWEGVMMAGEPPRVTDLVLPLRGLTGIVAPQLGDLDALVQLDLSGNRLTGMIPASLGRLSHLEALHLRDNDLWGTIPAALGELGLRDVTLSGNALTGCIPHPLTAAALSDFDRADIEPCALPPTTLTYDTYDTTGAVTTAGSYVFLSGESGTTAVTTYEGLRDGTTTALLIHKSDAAGTSQADVFDTVEAGDLFEWKEANDCFVRYAVTEVKPDPAGTVPRKLLGVESIAYAFTGCSGAITTGSASGSAANSASSSTTSITWGALPNLGGTSLTAPIVQGPFQLVPAGWTGATKPVGPRFPAGPPIPFAETTSLAEARTFPHWREPQLPEGWTFTYASSGDEVEVGYFEAFYDGYRLVVSANGITAKYGVAAASATYTNNGSQTSVRETLQIAGRPARVHRGITDRQFRVTVLVWDEATGVLYMLRGSPDTATLIAFAESMFE